MQAQLQSFGSSIEAQAGVQGGSVGLGFFGRQFVQSLRTMALAQVDTEAERDAIVAYAMKLADAFVAPRFGPLWPLFRGSLQGILDGAIDALPGLLAAQES